MKALVTGGTGFVGTNLVRELLADGYAVRVLARKGSDKRALEGLTVELAEGDLLDEKSLRSALDGITHLYHVAADYRLWVPDPETLYRTNVEGTRALFQVARDQQIERVVYTSSVGALGILKDGRPGTEESPVALDEMVGHYKRSKFLAERVAEEFSGKGLPVVIVNPSAPVGPWDVKPTPTGQMIVDFLKGRMFGYMATGLNVVHVKDVARGHILAAEKGRIGEKYILGNRDLTLKEILDTLARITGLPAPRFRVPYSLAFAVGCCFEGWAKFSRRPPRVALTGVRMAAKRMYFSPEKAIRELGLPQTPVEQALRDAVDWFRSHGMVPDKGTRDDWPTG
jgi:dihydroflavonol-4-reductase